jgi:hypothetical protein
MRDQTFELTHRPSGVATGDSVAFVAAPYGFGPSSKAIAISSHLPRSMGRVFLGDGPSLEMARHSNEFSACIRLDFATPANLVADVLSRYGGVIFVNSTRFVAAATATVGAVTFVDTLAWLRAQRLALPTAAVYFAQAFFDHAFSADLKAAANVRVTGAIVPAPLTAMRAPDRPDRYARSPVVHCGGLCSPIMRDGADVAFAEQLLDTLRVTGARARVILPRHLHHIFAGRLPQRISLIECSPISVREHVVDSPFALTTSGIEFTYESVVLGVPTLFLPPFNGSQHFQLEYHRRAFAGSVPFSLPERHHLQASELDEATAIVQAEGMAGAWRRQYQELREHLTRVLDAIPARETLQTLREHQAVAMRAVGADGAQTIAAHVMRDLKAKGRYQCASQSM